MTLIRRPLDGTGYLDYIPIIQRLSRAEFSRRPIPPVDQRYATHPDFVGAGSPPSRDERAESVLALALSLQAMRFAALNPPYALRHRSATAGFDIAASLPKITTKRYRCTV